MLYYKNVNYLFFKLLYAFSKYRSLFKNKLGCKRTENEPLITICEFFDIIKFHSYTLRGLTSLV